MTRTSQLTFTTYALLACAVMLTLPAAGCHVLDRDRPVGEDEITDPWQDPFANSPPAADGSPGGAPAPDAAMAFDTAPTGGDDPGHAWSGDTANTGSGATADGGDISQQVSDLGPDSSSDATAAGCGGGPPCKAGLDCVEDQCRCVKGGSCTGCCATADECMLQPTAEACGFGGSACAACDERSNACISGTCACDTGTAPGPAPQPCPDGQQCVTSSSYGICQ